MLWMLLLSIWAIDYEQCPIVELSPLSFIDDGVVNRETSLYKMSKNNHN